jgi:hypothetical protein
VVSAERCPAVVVAVADPCSIVLSYWLFHSIRFAIVLLEEQQDPCQRRK